MNSTVALLLTLNTDQYTNTVECNIAFDTDSDSWRQTQHHNGYIDAKQRIETLSSSGTVTPLRTNV